MKNTTIIKLTLSVLLLLVLLMSSCSKGYQPVHNPELEQYYNGNEGIRMWIDPGAPPPRQFYYSNADQEYNAFSIDVEIHNVGASFTRGGLYISGYDPSLIYVEGMNIPRDGNHWWQNCRVSFDSFQEAIGGMVGCNFGGNGASFGWDGQGNWNTNIQNLFQLVGLDKWPEVSFSYDTITQRTSFGFDLFGLMGDGVLEGYNGLTLLSILAPLQFDRFNGKEFELLPDNHIFPGGESTIVSFPAYVTNAWPPGLDATSVSFLITSCYVYSTYATPVVCIDPQPYSMNKKACRPGVVELKGSQGAPVAVTRVTQESGPTTIIFTIEITNVGDGDIIYPGDLELCSPYYPGRLGLQSLDTIIVGDIRMSGSPLRLQCSPSNNMVKLRDGKGQITCIYPIEYGTAKSAYKAPLIIELWYGYSETQMRNMYIKRVT